MAVTKYDRTGRKSNYGVRWTAPGGMRRFRFFPTDAARNSFYKALCRQEKQIGNSLLSLSVSEASAMRRCVEMLGSVDDVVAACREYADRVTVVAVTSRQAAAEYMAEMEKLKRAGDYIRGTRNVLAALVERFPSSPAEWTAAAARSWCLELIDGGFRPITVRNYVTKCRTFCGWCVRRGFCRSNVFTDVPVPDIVMPEPQFLQVDQMRTLLDTARSKIPDAVAYLALGGFAGIRSSACARLDMRAIDFKKRGVLIRADQAKNKRRIYIDGYEPNLWQWLDWARRKAPAGFSLTKRAWEYQRSRLMDQAGIAMPKNALRHSFCTYHVALRGDAGQTATLLSHRGNVGILYEHYRGNASREDAAEWFGLVPA